MASLGMSAAQIEIGMFQGVVMWCDTVELIYRKIKHHLELSKGDEQEAGGVGLVSTIFK